MQFLKFPVFYKKYGVRYVENAISPLPKVLMDMPENSAVHVYDEGSGLFPNEGIPFIDNSKKKIPLINIVELMDKSHTLSRVNNPINQKLSDFIRSNKKFIKSNASLADIKDEKTVVVFNYNPIKSFYKYAEGIVMNTFWKWFDVYDTLWNNVNEQTKISPRNHYLFMDVPTQLPAKSRLEANKEANNQGMLKFFSTYEDFFLLDLWRWVHPETRSLSSLGRIGTEHLSKINLMLRLKDGRYVALNLGYINSWIVGQPNQTDKKTITQRKPGLIATLVLVFMIRLQSVTEDEDPSISDHLENGDIDDLEEGTAASFQTSPEEDSEPESLDDDLSSGIGKPGKEKISKKSLKSSIKEQLKKIDKDQKASEDTRTIEDTLQDAEGELEALEDISRRREAISGPIEVEEEYDPEGGVSREEVEKDVFGIRTPKERLIEQLDQVVSNGLMNAADYRKILKNIEKQETMLNPYGGNETIQEFITVKPEDLEIKKEDTELVADGRVLDPSMKSSVVEAFDKTYITKVMRKDIMATIFGIQNSGAVITNIDTSISRSITGSFEVHSVTVKPLRGESSTLRIRVPVVDPDGTYVANAIRYHLRKQRTDLPCRKTDPSRVGLSSHTGKLSISRPSKQAQKELTSVFKKIDRGSIGEEANIYKVIAANVLDKEFEGPYIFNALSESYKGFTVKHEIFGDLNFDFSRKEYVGSKDRVMCGITAKGHQIVVNNDDTFDIITPNGIQKLGNIHEILDIDRTKVPVDAAILKVVGQQIPIGLVLCRSVGLRGMIKLLNCKYRVEDSKKRKALEPDEYAVTFKNKRYVFNRNDKQASLILGGLTHFEKQLKNYDVEVFDNKEIYNHLLETMGCGVSVGRELDHLETSYVDPVTQRLLIKMNEPATFLGLLTRSASLLTNYSSPMPQDMDVQQIRGYDRIAGAIHKQLYKAVRTFKNKNLSTRTKIDMGHFAVWSAIREDPAKKTCEDINPIQNLKMHESVTFVGEGGRSKEAFMKEDRAFNVKDAGVISGDSVDSGDVGINIFMSANPRLGDVTGTKSKSDEPLGAGNYLSPSILLAAGAQYDD